VRTAVSTLISSFDLYDRDQDRKLLAEVDAKEICQASLTVMMRLVFLMCAEERGLLLLGKNENSVVAGCKIELAKHPNQ
jgi:hypothetical protein